MSVRWASTSAIKWSSLNAVRETIDLWAKEEVPKHPNLLRLGYHGSYAREDWGVGSDLDLIAIVTESSEAFGRRHLSWSLASLPVPSDLMVYTRHEWESLMDRGDRFARTMARETVWIYVKEEGGRKFAHSKL
jgi:uncharacterized protein